MGVGAIFKEEQAVPVADPLKSKEVGHPVVQMDGDDRPGDEPGPLGLRDRPFEADRIDAPRAVLDVH
jgi:hypothetical protein